MRAADAAVAALRALPVGGPLAREPGWTPARARLLAEIAHDGQVDKAGEPSIGHPVRVAAHARERTAGVDRDDVAVVALLHDVPEDTRVTADDLRDAGLPDHLVAALTLLDHSDGRPYAESVEALAGHPLARAVKLADLLDNTDPRRLAALGADTRRRLLRKYGPVQARLAAVDAGDWARGPGTTAAGASLDARPVRPGRSRQLGRRTDAGGSRTVRIRSDDAGGLVVEGRDVGPAVEEFWGGGEYEWAVTGGVEALPTLAEVLDVDVTDVFDAVARRFRGDAAFALRRLLEDHDLVADRWSWVS